MNHSDIQNRMADYLEGDLSLAKRAVFDAHLDACEECSTELSEMRGTIGLLRRLPTPEPPSDLADNVMRRISEGEGQPGLLGRLERWFGELSSLVTAPGFAVPATALAAGLAVVLVTGDRGLSLPSFETEVQPTQVAQRSSGSAAHRLSRDEIKDFADALAGLRSESLAQNNSAVDGVRLGLRGSDFASDESRVPTGRMGRGTGDHSLELASAVSGAAAEAKSVRTRDEWLAVLIEQPQVFAREHAELSSVEQELWITHLSRRAVELGSLEAVVSSLRATADPVAVALADSFGAAALLR